MSETAAPPRVLLVTDADLSAGSRGAGRTLVNLFSRYPADRLLAVSGSATVPFTLQTGARVLGAAPRLPGRLTQALRPRVGHVDAAWVARRSLPEREAIGRFDPQLVLAVPGHAIGVALAERCRGLAPLVTYLMDDWLAYEPGVPMAFDTQRRGRQLLRDSVAWLSISPYLLRSTREFAGVDRPAHIVHNPVVVGPSAPRALEAPRTGRVRVAYAGSVWPMHWDAVTAVAQGVQRLRDSGVDIEFVLFTDRFFWGRHEADWQRWGVVDGGLIPYAALGSSLGECDLLLVASSFEPSQAHMSRSSIQTKVTDYMAAGRPILACGPADAASNRFLREYNCAYFAEDPTPGAIDAALRTCIASRAEGTALARRAWDAVRREHELVGVTDRLYAFLAAAAGPLYLRG
ncbi:MAG: hypothetical protein HYV19_13470 [Gemmatimonadetes bacterium]|nr:hypothetical protein [Gemmatimonadota bacterium]